MDAPKPSDAIDRVRVSVVLTDTVANSVMALRWLDKHEALPTALIDYAVALRIMVGTAFADHMIEADLPASDEPEEGD